LNSVGQVVKTETADERIVSASEIASINSVKTLKDGELALVSIGNPKNPQFSIFDTTSNSWNPLPNTIYAVSPSPDGKEIAYLDRKGTITNIMISTPDLKKPRKVISLHILDSEILWSGANTLLLLEKPSAITTNSAWAVNTKNGTMERIAQANGLIISSSLSGGLRFSIEGNQRKLELTSPDGKEVVSQLPFITLPQKCTFDAKYLYCAVPQNLSNNVVLPDDYLKKAFYSLDTIYKYNLTSGDIEELFSSYELEAVDAVDLEVDGGVLYFLNRYDSFVYSLDI